MATATKEKDTKVELTGIDLEDSVWMDEYALTKQDMKWIRKSYGLLKPNELTKDFMSSLQKIVIAPNYRDLTAMREAYTFYSQFNKPVVLRHGTQVWVPKSQVEAINNKGVFVDTREMTTRRSRDMSNAYKSSHRMERLYSVTVIIPSIETLKK